MCGLVGWFQRDGGVINSAVLEAMTRRLAHRGPDGTGIWRGASMGLGHRRLAIRDLSERGRQPLSDAGARVFISYNGEIYNDATLRHELARDHGVVFRSTCDAETIPYAYLAWGERAFERLEGMFAIALWDRDAQVLYLARDGIGIKPLFYVEARNALLFASEPKALFIHPAIRRSIDPEGLHTYLATGHPGPEASIYAGVRQVPPGTVLSFGMNRHRTWCYWKPCRAPEVVRMEPAVEMLHDKLEEVVESQVVADVPIGILQSGGIDSTLVTLSTARCIREASIFTAAFRDPTYDETEMAASVARVAGRPHQIISMETELDPEAVIGSIAYHVDGQCADTGLMAFFQLSRAVRSWTKVVLSGDGGDEFFAGYDTYTATRAAARLSAPGLRPVFERMGRLLYNAFPGNEQRLPSVALLARFLLGLGAGDAPPHLQWRRLVPRPMVAALYGPAMREMVSQSPYGAYRAPFDEQKGALLDKALIADQRYHLQSVLMKVDMMSMAHGLEVRVPLLDRRIMDLAGRLSLDLLAPRGGPGKLVLRRLAARLGASAEITSGRKKGFNVPIAALMRQGLARLGDRLMDQEADILAPFVNPDTLRRLWRAHRERRANHAFALWPLLLLSAYVSGCGSNSARSPAPTS